MSFSPGASQRAAGNAVRVNTGGEAAAAGGGRRALTSRSLMRACCSSLSFCVSSLSASRTPRRLASTAFSCSSCMYSSREMLASGSDMLPEADALATSSQESCALPSGRRERWRRKNYRAMMGRGGSVLGVWRIFSGSTPGSDMRRGAQVGLYAAFLSQRSITLDDHRSPTLTRYLLCNHSSRPAGEYQQ